MVEPYWERIRRLKDERGLTFDELVRRGLSSSTAQALMRPYEPQRDGQTSGSRYPTAERLEQVADALRVPPADFAEYRLARARELLDERAQGLDAALRCLEAFDSAQQRLAEESSASEAQRIAATGQPDEATAPGSRGPVGA